jgi:hypothetical protein
VSYRNTQLLPATFTERTMLDVCVATFTGLAAQNGALLRLPLPPFSFGVWTLRRLPNW